MTRLASEIARALRTAAERKGAADDACGDCASEAAGIDARECIHGKAQIDHPSLGLSPPRAKSTVRSPQVVRGRPVAQ